MPPPRNNLARRHQDHISHTRVVELPVAYSDAAIVRGIREGRPESAARLVERYADHVQRVLARVLGPDPDLRDLVQDVFVAALSSVEKLSEPKALKSWLTQVAVFLARGRIRRRQRWRFLVFRPSEELPEQAALQAPEEISEALRATYSVLRRLEPDHRIAFALRFIDGMELTTVADACGVSLATVKRRLAKAQLEFRRLASDEPALSEWLNGGEA